MQEIKVETGWTLHGCKLEHATWSQYDAIKNPKSTRNKVFSPSINELKNVYSE